MDEVSVLFICPEANTEFRQMRNLPEVIQARFAGRDVLVKWQGLVPSKAFVSIPTEDLLDILNKEASSVDPTWVEYLRKRYDWRAA